ncbi:MAG: DUF1329 domain-containing protein [Nevskiaceae bacterium]|nr:MAG: DUF1329 domain-containing protein [Nevskiaceae bacterium]TBR73711.1 MAG: DUF1329 domain-containing protein [Nevskiaceae bacterium]
MKLRKKIHEGRFATVLLAALAVATLIPVTAVQAKATAEQIAQLNGPKYTCMGAERAGGDGVAAFTGKYVGTWPGLTGDKQGYKPGPYASEQPTVTITAQNMAQHADKLTPGQQAMLKKYPQSFQMNVYPSHRDFGFPAWVCDVTKKNAATSEVVDDGKGATGVSGSIPFPFPQNGLEAVWNVINPYRAWTEQAIYDIADVYAGGKTSWGRVKFMTLNPGNNPDPAKRGSYTDKINAYFYQGYLLPARQSGFVAVGYQPNNFSKDATRSWQYLPGLRRVREAPKVGFDYPVPPAGLRVVSDDYGFNGSPERFTWKLVGKKTMYVPYDNFKINDPSIKYDDLVKPDTINPKYVRYEPHRVWVIEGDLKPGVRDVYSKRMLYVDEDSWLVLWADNYDGRGNLWRTTFVNYFYSPASQAFERGVSVFTDLTANSYEADYLVNERGEKGWWKINLPMQPAQFSPQAAASGGH